MAQSALQFKVSELIYGADLPQYCPLVGILEKRNETHRKPPPEGKPETRHEPHWPC
jgi:hypothetical protein